MTQIPISGFEFVIMQAADPEKAKLYRPYTREEYDQHRIDNIKQQVAQLQIKKP